VYLSYLLIPLEEKGVGGPTQTFARHSKAPDNFAAAGASCLPIGGNLYQSVIIIGAILTPDSNLLIYFIDFRIPEILISFRSAAFAA
jgi:hypothetical protein